MILEDIDYLLDESDCYVAELSAGAKWTGYSVMSVATLSPLTIVAFAIYRYMTGVNRWQKKIREYETALKTSPDDKTKLKFKLKLMKATAKLEQAQARTKQEKIKYAQKVEKAKYKLAQFKPPFSDDDKKKMDSIKKDLSKAQAVLSKHGIS